MTTMAAQAPHLLVGFAPARDFGVDVRPVSFECRFVRLRRHRRLRIGGVRPRRCLRGSAAGDERRQRETNGLQHGTPNAVDRTRERAGTARFQRAAAWSAVRAGAEAGRGGRVQNPTPVGRRTGCDWNPGTETQHQCSYRAQGRRSRSRKHRRCRPRRHAAGRHRMRRRRRHGGGCRHARGPVLRQQQRLHDAIHTAPSARRHSRAAATPRAARPAEQSGLCASREESYPSCPSFPSATRQVRERPAHKALKRFAGPSVTGHTFRQFVQFIY